MPKSDEKPTRTLFELRNAFEAGSGAVPGVIRTPWACILAPKTANLVAKMVYLAAKTAQLGVPKPSRVRPGASPERRGAAKIPPKAPESARERNFVDFSSIFGWPGPLLASIFGGSCVLFERGFGRSCFACGVSTEMPKTPRSIFSAFYLLAVRAGKCT